MRCNAEKYARQVCLQCTGEQNIQGRSALHRRIFYSKSVLQRRSAVQGRCVLQRRIFYKAALLYNADRSASKICFTLENILHGSFALQCRYICKEALLYAGEYFTRYHCFTMQKK